MPFSCPSDYTQGFTPGGTARWLLRWGRNSKPCPPRTLPALSTLRLKTRQEKYGLGTPVSKGSRMAVRVVSSAERSAGVWRGNSTPKLSGAESVPPGSSRHLTTFPVWMGYGTRSLFRPAGAKRLRPLLQEFNSRPRVFISSMRKRDQAPQQCSLS